MIRTLPLALLLYSIQASAQSYSLSPTFGTNGTQAYDVGLGIDLASDHALQPDGKLLLGGSSYDISTNSYYINMVRIDTTCGQLDTTFGTDGMLLHTFEQRTISNAIALQPDGRIVGCGMIAPNNFGSQQWPGVFRFMPDGSVDSTFNGIGYHRLAFNGSSGEFNAISIGVDGSITCMGDGFSGSIGAVRFTTAGALDINFGSGGTAALALPTFQTSARGGGIVRPDGAVITISDVWNGSGENYVLALSQFDATGTPDTTFGTNGLVVSELLVSNGGESLPYGTSLQTDGKLLVSFTPAGPPFGFAMARFNTDGSLDITYGLEGISSVQTPLDDAYGGHHQRLEDGSTLQFGFTNSSFGLERVITVLKRNADGEAETTFGTAGFIQAPSAADPQDQSRGGLLLPSGRIIVYGSVNANMLAGRLTPTPLNDDLPVISMDATELVTTGSGSLQWFLDGVEIPGATGDAFVPTENGEYTVVMTISADCNFTSEPFTLLSVGIEEDESKGIHVLGNPVSEVLTILNDGPVATYRMVDLQGKHIAAGKLTTGKNELQPGTLKPGMYLLHTTSAKGIEVARIVVVR